MMHRILRVAARLARGAVLTVGAAVVLAMVVGVANTALAGTGVGAAFNLGKANKVNALSRLVGGASSAMLLVDNNGTGPALDLQVGPSEVAPDEKTAAPMKVDSGALVENLNADRLDGRDASAFLAADGKAADADRLDGRDSADFLGANVRVRYGSTSTVPPTGPIVREQWAFCNPGERLLSGGYTVTDDPANPPPGRAPSGPRTPWRAVR